jgi:hypothetical protein
MKKNTKRVLGGLVIAAGSLGALGAVLFKNGRSRRRQITKDVWARPGMSVTFRAELMPGQSRAARSFTVKELLPSGRVLLHGTGGEHAEKEFESVRSTG